MPQDKLIATPQSELFARSNPNSQALMAVVITGNKAKFAEFRAQLGDGYGMDILQWEPGDQEDFTDEDHLIEVCKKIMSTAKFSPHFILREETTLVKQKDGFNLTNLSLDELAKCPLERVVHTSTLSVLKPQWSDKDKPDLQKELTGFTRREYEKRSYGHIKRSTKNIEPVDGFGWDALFVNAATNLTNEEFYKHYGKKTARQHTISDFIEHYLRYKTLLSLKHHELPGKRPIDFGADYVHLTQFVTAEKHLSNPHIAEWGIENLRNAMINQGIYFKAAWSRVVKNYFSPPFSGLPKTAKKDAAEETIFMTHDMLHHLICDLICDLEPTQFNFYVYSAWRMISEACTLILADMLYADGLIKSGVDRACVDKRIYPLFECVKRVRNIPEPSQMKTEDKITFIKTLLFANVMYALLGDDSEWKKVLSNENGTIDEASLAALKAYEDHFGKFFIGDNAWTRANFDNMHKQEKPLKEWIKNVGPDHFRKANIPLLSDVCCMLRANKTATAYPVVVKAVFNLVFYSQIKPHLSKESVPFKEDALIQSKAFRRFLIGQASLFSRYPTPLNLEHIKTNILRRIQDEKPFTPEEQDELRSQFEEYILGIEGLRLMSTEEALNAIDCAAVFPPVYISYPEMQKKHTSIKNCVEQCVMSYKDKEENTSPSSSSAASTHPSAFFTAISLQTTAGAAAASLTIR